MKYLKYLHYDLYGTALKATITLVGASAGVTSSHSEFRADSYQRHHTLMFFVVVCFSMFSGDTCTCTILGPLVPLSGFLMISPLGMKARVGSALGGGKCGVLYRDKPVVIQLPTS